jgi:hypothetical protein
VLYVEQQSPPKPKKNVNHEDWVAGVAAMDNIIISGCYDNTVTLWYYEQPRNSVTIKVAVHCPEAHS